MTLGGRVGGSPFNVATGLARRGKHTTFLASPPCGLLGDRLLRPLREEGVGTEAVGTVVGREQADEAARVERFAQSVFHRPAAEIEGGIGADGVALDVQAASSALLAVKLLSRLSVLSRVRLERMKNAVRGSMLAIWLMVPLLTVTGTGSSVGVLSSSAFSERRT